MVQTGPEKRGVIGMWPGSLRQPLYRVPNSLSRVLERGTDARCNVASPTPSSEAIARKESPCARSAVTLPASTILRGLPSVFPFARAFRNPARTRSTIKLRSNSATASRTVNIILPVGVVVSICSLRLTNAMPSALNVSKARSR